jgi:hypothetical protein
MSNFSDFMNALHSNLQDDLKALEESDLKTTNVEAYNEKMISIKSKIEVVAYIFDECFD